MIYVFLANGFEEVEALTVVDLLRRAELNVKTVGIGSREISSTHGITVLCDLADYEADFDGLEMIVLPGGMPGTLGLENSEVVQSFITYASQFSIWIAAICAAPSILGHKGLLKGKKACCFPGFEEQLDGAKISQESVCVDGYYITAKGVGAAIDFSLKLVEVLTDETTSKRLRGSLQCPK